jgi:integrase
VSEVLGHASISVTSDIYVHLRQKSKKAAAEAMDRRFGKRDIG